MTNKLVVIINSLKVQKIKIILLYEMEFLVPNYSCLQNPWLGGYRPQIPVLSVLCPQLNLLNPPPRTKFLGTPLLLTSSLWHGCGYRSFGKTTLLPLRLQGRTTLTPTTLKMEGQHCSSPKRNICFKSTQRHNPADQNMNQSVMVTGDRGGIHQLLLRYQCIYRQWRVLRLDDASVLQTVAITCNSVSQQHAWRHMTQRTARPECMMTSTKETL